VVGAGDAYGLAYRVLPSQKWDGSDYPADSVGEAIAYVGNEAGRHFDPRLVECFLGILPQILAVRAEHSDREIEVHAESRAA
jgi:HD-GYP domain-containing protein (c-di-GMP phosphodiesterase class II)